MFQYDKRTFDPRIVKQKASGFEKQKKVNENNCEKGRYEIQGKTGKGKKNTRVSENQLNEIGLRYHQINQIKSKSIYINYIFLPKFPKEHIVVSNKIYCFH